MSHWTNALVEFYLKWVGKPQIGASYECRSLLAFERFCSASVH